MLQNENIPNLPKLTPNVRVMVEQHAKEVANWRNYAIKQQVIMGKSLLKMRLLNLLHEKKLSRNILYSSARRLAFLEAEKNQEIFIEVAKKSPEGTHSEMSFHRYGKVHIKDIELWLVHLRQTDIVIAPSNTSVIWKLSQCVLPGMRKTLKDNIAMDEHIPCMTLVDGPKNKPATCITVASLEDLCHSSLTAEENTVLKCCWECLYMKFFMEEAGLSPEKSEIDLLE